jgi:hypothetical protein
MGIAPHFHLWYQVLDGKSKVDGLIDDAITTISGILADDNRYLVYPVGGSLNIGDCAYLTASQEWELSKRDTASTMPAWGVVTRTHSGNADVLLEGLVTLTDYAGNFDNGDLIYVGLDGRLTNEYPTESGTGQYLQRMGYVHDGPSGKFEIDPDDTLVLID